MWVERKYRLRYPMTHQQYLDEPDRLVEWFMQFEGLD
jgi:hypothetical protein